MPPAPAPCREGGGRRSPARRCQRSVPSGDHNGEPARPPGRAADRDASTPCCTSIEPNGPTVSSTRLARAARRAAAGPVRARGRRRPDPRHGALAHAAHVRAPRRERRPPDGVCANVEFPSPRAAGRGGGGGGVGHRSRRRSVAARARGMAAARARRRVARRAVAARLAAHLGVTADGRDPGAPPAASAPSAISRGSSTATRVQRPDMLRAWAGGDDADGAGARSRPTPSGRPSCGGACATGSRSRTRPSGSRARARACAPSPPLAALPDRLSLFGLTRLPAAHLQVLRALAAAPRRPPLPAAPVARAVGEGRRGDAARSRRSVRRARRTRRRPPGQPPARLVGPGRARAAARARRGRGDAADHHHPVRRAGGTLLARLQADVRADRAPAGPPLPGAPDGAAAARSRRPQRAGARLPRARAPGRGAARRDPAPARGRPGARAARRDRDVPGHRDVRAAHPRHLRRGRRRREEEDERDALPPEVRPPDLRVRLADRALRQTNPVLGVVAQLIDLADAAAHRLAGPRPRGSRAGPAPLPARRRRPRPPAGLGGRERHPVGPGRRPPAAVQARGAVRADTWRAGLDRLLLGVTMTEEEHRLFGDVLPLDDVESGAIDLAGRLAELVDRLRAALDALGPSSRSRTGPPRSPRPRTRSRRPRRARPGSARSSSACSTTSWREASRRHACARAARDPRAAAERLQGRPTRANFRTGHLTVCTLVPMRSVPHRVVCLLGWTTPSSRAAGPRDGDDLILDDPHVGDRDGRTEDRQMLLDALLAAGERLIVTYTGNDERTNAERPPAVPVGRAARRDRAHGRGPRHGDARARVVVRHPLQPFDPRNFPPAALAGDARLELRPRDARRGPRADRPARRARAVPGRLRCPPCGAGARARGPRALRRAAGARLPAAAARTRRRRRAGRDRGRPAGRARRPRAVGRRPAAARRAARRRGRADGAQGRDRARHAAARAARPAGARGRVARRGGDRRRGRRAAGGDGAPVGSVDVRVALRRRRACSAARCRASPATVLRTVTYSRVTRGTGSSPGCACSRSPPRTPTSRSRR